MSDKVIYGMDEHGNDTDVICARLLPASAEAAQKVINAPLNDDGRSEWFWLRFPNGDLMLACFPKGDTYIDTELDHNGEI